VIVEKGGVLYGRIVVFRKGNFDGMGELGDVQGEVLGRDGEREEEKRKEAFHGFRGNGS
jgi:hypothetical protein